MARKESVSFATGKDSSVMVVWPSSEEYNTPTITYSKTDGRLFANNIFLTNCVTPFRQVIRRGEHRSELARQPRDVGGENRKAYCIPVKHEVEMTLHAQQIHSMKSHAIFCTNEKVAPNVRVIGLTTALRRMMEGVLDPLKNQIVDAFETVLASHDFRYVIADSHYALDLFRPDKMKRRWFTIEPSYTEQYLSSLSVSNQNEAEEFVIVDALLKGHGILPLTSLPPTILSRLLPEYTDLPEIISDVRMAKKKSILVFSAMNAGWVGYVEHTLKHLGYGPNILPVTIFGH